MKLGSVMPSRTGLLQPGEPVDHISGRRLEAGVVQRFLPDPRDCFWAGWALVRASTRAKSEDFLTETELLKSGDIP